MDFFEILCNEREGAREDGNFFNGCSEKIIMQGKWVILGLKMTCPNNFGSTLRIFFFEILHNEKAWNCFSEKILIQGKWAILCLKMTRSHNFGSTLKIFLKFCAVKGTKKFMEILLMIFWKKFSFGANWPFWAQKWCTLIDNSGSTVRVFLKFAQ